MNKAILKIISSLAPAPITRKRESHYSKVAEEIRLARERGFAAWEIAEILKQGGHAFANPGGVSQFVRNTMPDLVNPHVKIPLAFAAAKRGPGRPKGSLNKVKH